MKLYSLRNSNEFSRLTNPSEQWKINLYKYLNVKGLDGYGSVQNEEQNNDNCIQHIY